MKPPVFEYFRPESLAEALALRSEYGHDSAILAGGQSLMPLLNLRMAFPGILIDLGRIPELQGIREWGDGVALGAMVRQRSAERSELVRARCPLLGSALEHVGHVTIRNRGTVGGSIAHADPASELPATALALDAELVARSIRGERTIAARDFFRGFLTTALEPDEILTEICFPRSGSTGTAFLEIARRHGDFALVGVGVAVEQRNGSLADARLVFIGVGGTPIRTYEAEEMLRGGAAGADAFAAAAERAAASLEPESDIHASSDYRRRVARVLARRALQEATR